MTSFRLRLLWLFFLALFHASHGPCGRMLTSSFTPLIRAFVPASPVLRRDVFGRFEVLPGNGAWGDLGIGAYLQFDPRGGKAVGEFDEAVQRGEIVDVVG